VAQIVSTVRARVGGLLARRQLEPEDEQFWNLVRDLPGRQTQAITLFYLEDRSINEISEILGCSPNTAKVHLFRGRQALATRLGLEAPVEP